MKLSRITFAVAGMALAFTGSNAFASDCLSTPYKDGESHAFLPASPNPHASDSYADADMEFGAGALANTECVGKQGKLVLQVDSHLDSAGSAPWLSTYGFFLRNYEIQGLEAGKDVKIAVVLSARGALLGTNGNSSFIGGSYTNPAVNIAKVKDALNRGFEVYVCQTAARGLGIQQSDLIEGIKFTPGGHLMVADKQMDGYAHLIYK